MAPTLNTLPPSPANIGNHLPATEREERLEEDRMLAILAVLAWGGGVGDGEVSGNHFQRISLWRRFCYFVCLYCKEATCSSVVCLLIEDTVGETGG